MGLIDFFKGSYTEFKDRVEWPKWSYLQSSTIVVAIVTFLLALFTFGVDSLFSTFIRNVFSMLVRLFN